jgi:hypothetical protein
MKSLTTKVTAKVRTTTLVLNVLSRVEFMVGVKKAEGGVH